ncbi:unnamed protein product [Moneuplotes crassus]|uniref:Uncharacterized protein n=1 Tax=Euplotes crassus TaxID=5936 RepID=A0AAD1YB54_EUPCR|nr:unnamed protein product [Moneuplotes crassus]
MADSYREQDNQSETTEGQRPRGILKAKTPKREINAFHNRRISWGEKKTREFKPMSDSSNSQPTTEKRKSNTRWGPEIVAIISPHENNKENNPPDIDEESDSLNIPSEERKRIIEEFDSEDSIHDPVEQKLPNNSDLEKDKSSWSNTYAKPGRVEENKLENRRPKPRTTNLKNLLKTKKEDEPQKRRPTTHPFFTEKDEPTEKDQGYQSYWDLKKVSDEEEDKNNQYLQPHIPERSRDSVTPIKPPKFESLDDSLIKRKDKSLQEREYNKKKRQTLEEIYHACKSPRPNSRDLHRNLKRAGLQTPGANFAINESNILKHENNRLKQLSKNKYPKIVNSILKDIKRIDSCKTMNPDLILILRQQRKKLKTIARIMTQINEKKELEQKLLKMMKKKITNEQFISQIETLKAKEKIIKNKHTEKMFIDNVYSKLFIKHLVQCEICYTEMSPSTPIVFELFPITPITRGKEKLKVSNFGLFKVKLLVTKDQEKLIDISCNYDLKNLFSIKDIPTYYANSKGETLEPVEAKKVISCTFTFLCDKINMVVQAANNNKEEINIKTLINLCTNNLFGYKLFLEDLRDIYAGKYPKIYLDEFKILESLLENQEMLTAEEPLVFITLCVINPRGVHPELILTLKGDYRYLFTTTIISRPTSIKAPSGRLPLRNIIQYFN